MLKIKTTCFIFFVSTCLNAWAFKSDEHKRLGDLALEIAFDYECLSCVGDTEGKRYCELLRPRPDQASYGDIVERVDHMLSPNMIFSGIGESVSYPASHSDLNPVFFGQHKRYHDSYLRSSHNNESHFQAYVLFNFHDWHRRAMMIADKEQNLFAALVASAARDHYLHDFFAPGHIATPRYNLPDAVALGMHDINNDLGARFTISNWEDIQPILAFIERSHGYGIDSGAITSLAKDHEFINLHGDGYLSDNPKQELFMLLVEVRAISDVIRCHATAETCESPIDAYTWRTSTIERQQARRSRSSPEARMHFGEYSIPILHTQTFSPIVGLSAMQDSLFLDETQYRLRTSVEALLLGVPGAPDFLRDRQTHEPLSETNWGLAVGYQHLLADGYSAHGPEMRLIMARPQIELQASAYLSHLEYEQGHISERKWGYGIRGDIGFSMVTASVSVGKDYGFTSAGVLDDGLAVAFGLTVAFPVSGIPVARDIERKLYSGSRLPNN